MERGGRSEGAFAGIYSMVECHGCTGVLYVKHLKVAEAPQSSTNTSSKFKHLK